MYEKYTYIHDRSSKFRSENQSLKKRGLHHAKAQGIKKIVNPSGNEASP